MKANLNQPATMDIAEPKAVPGQVPVWLFFLGFVLLFWGMYYFDQRSGWFKTEVYSPYISVADLQRYQPPTGGVYAIVAQKTPVFLAKRSRFR